MMFYVNDYPEWVSKLECGLKCTEFEYCIVEDDELWLLVRESKEVPHLANAWVIELFNRIEAYLTDTYGQDIFNVDYYVNGMNSSLTIDEEEIKSYKDLREVVDKKRLNKDKVIIFSSCDAVNDDLVAQVELTDEITVDIFKESKDSETRYYPFIYDNDGDHNFERLDFYWENRPEEGILEAYDFSVHLDNYLDDIKELEDEI